MTRTLLCYGDSNTHGTMPMHHFGEMDRFDRSTRWTGQLAALLAGWTIVEEGQPGRTTVHDDPIEGRHRKGLTVLPAVLESHRPIDAVLLMLGTNDLKGRFSLNATDIALSLEKLVQVIRASGCGPDQSGPAVLLVAPPPILEIGDLGAIFEGGAEKSRALGRQVGAAAGRLGVPFVDAGTLIGVSRIDGIHYDAAAHARLARAFAEAITAHFP